jgi:hypothetical protein
VTNPRPDTIRGIALILFALGGLTLCGGMTNGLQAGPLVVGGLLVIGAFLLRIEAAILQLSTRPEDRPAQPEGPAIPDRPWRRRPQPPAPTSTD